MVSVAGSSLGDYAELARRVGRAPGVAAVEVNVVRPRRRGSGVFDVREPFHAAGAVSAVRRELPRDVPVLAKLRSDLVRVVESARTAIDAGAAAVVIGNAAARRRCPTAGPGGLSGPAIRAARAALRCRGGRPPARRGGRRRRRDRRQPTTLAPSSTPVPAAVQVGTALLHDPTTRCENDRRPAKDDQ